MVENLLKTLEFDWKDFKVIEKDWDFWFVAKNICDCLWIKDVSSAMDRVLPEDTTTTVLNPTGKRPIKTIIVNEPWLYSLILWSRKKQAKPFKKWVTSEVLPSIRKTGSYSTNQPPVGTLEFLEYQLKLMKDHESKIKNIDKRVTNIEDEKKEAIEEMGKLPYTDEKLPEKTSRVKIREIINNYVKRKWLSWNEWYRAVWKKLKTDAYYRLSIRDSKQFKTWLDYVESKWLMDELYLLASEIFR